MEHFSRSMVVLLMACLTASSAHAQGTTLVSADANGVPFIDDLYLQGGLMISPPPSDDGRYVLFTTDVAGVVPGNGSTSDVFRRDLWTGAVELVSRPRTGTQANGFSWEGGLSADGSVVAFTSGATDLVAPGDDNQVNDVFVRDLDSGTTVAVTQLAGGGWPNGSSMALALSTDGNHVVFHTWATNLVPPLPPGVTNGLYVKDLVTGTFESLSVDPSGTPINGSFWLASISGDGRRVAFWSNAGLLVAGDTNGSPDVFVRDRLTGTTVRASVTSAGAQVSKGGNKPMISRDGAVVIFGSDADDLVADDGNLKRDLFAHELASGQTICISRSVLDGLPAGGCSEPRVSADGRFVISRCTSPEIVPGLSDPATVRFDLLQGTAEQVSQSTFGAYGTANAPGSISGDGRFCTFFSAVPDLVPDDTNGDLDLFLRDMGSGRVSTYCQAKTNSQGCVTWMSFAGKPGVTAPTPFLLRAAPAINKSLGVMIYSHGFQLLPFQDGLLCVGPQVRRTPPQNSGGNSVGVDCTGTFELDMNAFIQAGSDPALVQGAQVYAQYWSRDPQAAIKSNLSNAVMFEIDG